MRAPWHVSGGVPMPARVRRALAVTSAALLAALVGGAVANAQTSQQESFLRAHETYGLLPDLIPSGEAMAAADRDRCFALAGAAPDVSSALTGCNGYLDWLYDDGPCPGFMGLANCEGSDALRRDIELVATHLRRGNLQRIEGATRDFAGAVEDYSRAIELTGEELAGYAQQNGQEVKGLEALLERGRTYGALGRLDLAEADLDRLAGLWPAHPLPWLEKARLAAMRGDFAAAVPLLDQAIARQPGFALAYYHRAYARNQLGDRAGAMADCNAAHQLDARLSCN